MPETAAITRFPDGIIILRDFREDGSEERRAWLQAVLADSGLTLVTEDTEQAAPDCPILVVYPAPEPGLAEALRAGEETGTAQADWTALAEAALAVIRAARRRCFAIEAGAFGPDGAATLRERLATWLERDLAEADPLPAEEAPAGSEAMLADLIAAQAVRQSRPLRKMLGELSAAGFSARGQAGFDPEEMAGLYEALRAPDQSQDQLQEQADAVAEAQQVLLAQLAEAQGGFEALSREQRGTEKALREAEETLEAARARLAELETAVEAEQVRSADERAQSAGERDLLRQQIEALQITLESQHKDYIALCDAVEALPVPVPGDAVRANAPDGMALARLAQARQNLQAAEQTRAELARLNAEMAALRDDRQRVDGARQAAETELQAVYASTSWRVTRPLRALRLMLSGQKGAR